MQAPGRFTAATTAQFATKLLTAAHDVGIVAGTRALDRYSFPSGHTLHATSFSILAIDAFPQLGWLCAPFAVLVAISRVILGLHYPTDVAAGAVIGTGLAVGAMVVAPAL